MTNREEPSSSDQPASHDPTSLSLSWADLRDLLAQGSGSVMPTTGTSLRASLTLPHPVVARDDVFLQEVQDCLQHSDHGSALSNPEAGEMGLAEAVQELYADDPQPVMRRWSEHQQAMYAAVCAAHSARDGVIVRATDALETLLSHTDIEEDMPTSMFAPPHPAVYVHFGALWRQRIQSLLGPMLALPAVPAEKATAHGCYLLQSRHHCEACGNKQRMIGLYLLIELRDEPGIYALTGFGNDVLHDEDAPLTETMIHKMDHNVPGGLFGALPSVLVGLLSKLFLYMRSEAARVVRHDDHSSLTKRLTQVGSRKAGKLQRRCERLCDWIEAGPVALPGGFGTGELPPHWRRGHLRQQAHGQNRALRKLIFIMPTMVRSDRLDSALPPDKRAGTQ